MKINCLAKLVTMFSARTIRKEEKVKKKGDNSVGIEELSMQNQNKG